MRKIKNVWELSSEELQAMSDEKELEDEIDNEDDTTAELEEELEQGWSPEESE